MVLVVNLEKSIEWFLNCSQRKIGYDMWGTRTGKGLTGDCSGVLYESLVKAGFPDSWTSYPPSTETLHGYLLSNGWELVLENINQLGFKPKKYDIFIWGMKGFSANEGGHTGMFYDDNEKIIHCNYRANGISIDDYDTIAEVNGWMYGYLYRYSGKTNNQGSVKEPEKINPIQPKPTGEKRYIYRVDDCQFINGMWQVRSNKLVPVNFNWTGNGIHVGDIDMVDSKTGAMLTNQQTVKTGMYFSINENHIINTTQPIKADGGYFWNLLTLKDSDKIWLSCWDKYSLVYSGGD